MTPVTSPDPSPSSSSAPEFIYVGDVMCSWCWGFAPTLHLLEERFGLPIRVINGGLRPGPHSQELDDQMAGYLGNHWEKVAEASGQPFDPSFLERRDGWRFDSETPAIAVTAMRDRDEKSALSFFADIQMAFFAEGVDITDPAEYRNLVKGYPVEADLFLDYLVSPEARSAAWKDFERARSLGIASFPALLLRTNGRLAIVTKGWQPYEKLEAPLSAYLSDQDDIEATGETCAIE